MNAAVAGDPGKQTQPPRLILVCGPWSSGTTAVAGMLAAMGLNGVPPYFHTNDERTRNSYESQAFREVIQKLATETGVSRLATGEQAMAALRELRARIQAGEFGAYTPGSVLFLKYPLSALLIPEISRVFATRLIYVLRPMKEIEATRARRGWAAHLGAEGARRIYSVMFDIQVNLAIPTLVVRYPELLAYPREHARQIAAYCGLKQDNPLVEQAAGFIRAPAAKVQGNSGT